MLSPRDTLYYAVILIIFYAMKKYLSSTSSEQGSHCNASQSINISQGNTITQQAWVCFEGTSNQMRPSEIFTFMFFILSCSLLLLLMGMQTCCSMPCSWSCSVAVCGCVWCVGEWTRAELSFFPELAVTSSPSTFRSKSITECF